MTRRKYRRKEDYIPQALFYFLFFVFWYIILHIERAGKTARRNGFEFARVTARHNVYFSVQYKPNENKGRTNKKGINQRGKTSRYERDYNVHKYRIISE